jgi:alkylhydroperoxidase family enzyme
MHTRDLLKKGQKIEKLALVQAWAEAGNVFDERERAALAWAETVTRVAETGVPDEAYQAVRAVFEEKELVDLTIVISLMNAYNRMAISFRNTPQAALESKTGRLGRRIGWRGRFNPKNDQLIDAILAPSL